MQKTLTGGRADASRILLVDHDAEARAVLRRRLLEDGYQVSTCADPAEALDQLRESQVPDLIVFELSTPVMNGWQFRLQQRRLPRMFGIPVIALSADRSAQAEAIDADAYLPKPIDYPSLRDTIARLLSALERRRAQERQTELGRLSSLRTLAAGVSHETSDPLTFVMGNISDAMERCVKAIEAESLEDARHSLSGAMDAMGEAMLGANRVNDVVHALSMFAQPPAAEEDPLDVAEVLEVAIHLTQNEVRPRALLVRDYGELPPVRGSKARLGQVFVNLLLNAARSIPEGHEHDSQIRIAAHSDEKTVIVQISDTGRGIAPEMLRHVYDPFFTTRPAGEGMGLGLSICHAAMQALGGSIDVESELGKGSVFTITLPRLEIQTRQPDTDTAESVSTPAGRRGSVLVVDDEPAVCRLLSSVLSEQYEVTALPSARQAMSRIIEGARYDVILCDLMMADMTGMDLYAALQKHAPDQVKRLVFLAGGAFTDETRRFLDSVSNTRIEKPFSLLRVLELVQQKMAG